MIKTGFRCADSAEGFSVEKTFRERCEIEVPYVLFDERQTVLTVLEFMDFDLKNVQGVNQILLRLLNTNGP